MEKFKILKRRSPKNGWLFFAETDRAYHSPYFNSPEERDRAVDKYIEKRTEEQKAYIENQKVQKELLNK